ncbi:hypothetical protein [Moraxella bovis]|uniref:Uncharacterized protein n=1 Tax=Moraxella bovis TaxID=476 RepID=A0ABY6M5W6_MORBO|nr:hypothetical protein [Moraxella bovis]UZA02938.1 hypothetical protein LP092_13535 [Moraxella bovis]UZA54031.1 hypothetical protein LP111_12750 [Moraxella bovis]UZA57363.1 hypothetical protein LP127_01425 [Moraxella bovis]
MSKELIFTINQFLDSEVFEPYYKHVIILLMEKNPTILQLYKELDDSISFYDIEEKLPELYSSIRIKATLAANNSVILSTFNKEQNDSSN